MAVSVGERPGAVKHTRDATFLGLLATGVFVVSLDNRAVVPLLPAIARDLGESVAATGLIVTAYSAPFALFQLAYGPLGDRLGRLRVITWALGGFVVGTALCALAFSLPYMLVVRVLTGSVAAAVYPLSLVHLGDTVPYDRRQAAIGVLASTASIAQVLSVSISGIVGEFLDWRLMYGLFSLFAAGTWIALVRAARQSPPAVARSAATDGQNAFARAFRLYAQVLKVPGLRLLYALVFVESALLFGGFAFVGAAIHDRFDIGLLTVGLLLTGNGIGAFAVARVLGPLVQRVGEARLALAGGLLMGGGFLLVQLMPWWQLGFVGALLMGAGFVAAHTTLQTRATELAPQARGTAVALHSFHMLIGQAIGAAALGGLLALAGSYDALLLTAAGGLALFGFVALRTIGGMAPRRAPA